MKTCSICTHAQRAAIDAALVSGQSLRDIVSGHNGTTRSALDRHRKHIAPALTLAKQAERVAGATTLLSRVEKLMSRCETIYEKAMAAKQWSGAVSATRELRCCLELLGKLSGELKTPGVNVAIKNSFAQISIKDLSDEQLRDLIDRYTEEVGISDDLEEEEPRVELTEVERLIRAGFHLDSAKVREALAAKMNLVRAQLADVQG